MLKNIQVSYHGTYKVLTDASHKQHVLYLCGTPAPSADGFAANASFWRVPISKVATTSTTYLPFLEMIGERGSLAAYASSFEYVTSACALKLHRDGDVAEAYDSASYSMDNAMLEDLGVELTIADMWSASAHNAFVMSDTQEDSVLKIAEYVELVALFFNREAEATAAITSMVENYMCAKASAAELAARSSGVPLETRIRTQVVFDECVKRDGGHAYLERDLQNVGSLMCGFFSQEKHVSPSWVSISRRETLGEMLESVARRLSS